MKLFISYKNTDVQNICEKFHITVKGNKKKKRRKYIPLNVAVHLVSEVTTYIFFQVCTKQPITKLTVVLVTSMFRVVEGRLLICRNQEKIFIKKYI